MEPSSNNSQFQHAHAWLTIPKDHSVVNDLKKYFDSESCDALDNYFTAYDQECPVCLEKVMKSDYSDSKLVITKCSHVFHKTCLQEVSEHNHSKTIDCPLCRKQIALQETWNEMQPTIHTLFKNRIDALNKPVLTDMNKICLKRNHEHLNPPKREHLSADEELARKLQEEWNKPEDDEFASKVKKIRNEQILQDEEFARQLAKELNGNTEPDVIWVYTQTVVREN
jgi:hypothetical protein